MMTKNQPKLSLTDLLRRRKMSLEQFIVEFGITTYEMLIIRCDRMGVNAPSEDLFRAIVGTTVVSSPTEGVVVFDVFPVIDEVTGDHQVESSDLMTSGDAPKIGRRQKRNSTIKE